MGVYVDGFNLYHGVHAWSGCRHLWLDVVELAQSLRPRNEVVHVHYFTAPVLDDSGAASRQGIYQSALQARHPDRLTVVQGRYQRKTEECRKCGNSYRRYEEKETDVSIAATLVADAARQKYDAALVISADSDLLPAIKIARDLQPDLFVLPAFPPKRNSDEIKRALPAALHIGKAKIKDAQLPHEVTSASGKVYRRPSKWCSAES